MKEKRKRPIHTPEEVFGWIMSTHQWLHERAEQDREWVWLAVDLRGDHNKEVRESLKEYGFRFAKRGHVLPSGSTGTWANACQRPMPFKRSAGAGSTGKGSKEPERLDDAALLAALEAI
jgi:hypothetical protein